jgi:hypothetical protein
MPVKSEQYGSASVDDKGKGSEQDAKNRSTESTSNEEVAANAQTSTNVPSSGTPQQLPSALQHQLETFNYFSKALTNATKASQGELVVEPYSDSLSLVTLSGIPQFTSTPDVPIARIGSSVFGLRDQPFISLDRANGNAELLVPTALLRDETKTTDAIVWMQLFAPSPTIKIYRIPRATDNPNSVSVCNLSQTLSPVFLSNTGTGTDAKSNYAIFGTRLETLMPVTNSGVTLDDLHDRTRASLIRILTVPNSVAKSAPSIVLFCGAVPVVVSLPAPPSGGSGTVKEAVNPPTGTISMNATSIQISGAGLDHVVQILYGGKSLQFIPAPPGDGTALTIVNLVPNDPFNPTSTTGSKSLLFIFADQISQTFSFKVQ